MRNALLELRRHPGRLVAVLLAVSISVAFLVASLTFSSTETRAIGRSVTARTALSDVVVDLNQPNPALPARIAAVPGVAAVEPSYTSYADFSTAEGPGLLTLEALPTDPALRWTTLASGRWPTTTHEVAVDRATAGQLGLAPGRTITFPGSRPSTAVAMTVTGITDQSRSLFSGLSSSGLVIPAFFTEATDPIAPMRLLVVADAATSPDVLAERVRTIAGSDTTVATSAEVATASVSELTRGANVFRYLLVVFASIALLVGAILITNTFTMLLAQRRRQIGLLRAIGASTAQVRRGVLAEAVVVGSVGSAAGVALGLGIAAVAAKITGSISAGLAVPLVGTVLAAATGVLVTVLAALLPAARAMRIAPLEAVRPPAERAEGGRGPVRVRNAAFLVMAGGAVLVVVALLAPSHNVVLAIGASMVLAVGILLAAPVFLPLVLRSVTRLTARVGPITRLAGLNTLRNPARAAATCTALMLGVGLIVTLQVGAASIKSTVGARFDAEYPVDVTVTNPAGPLSPDVLRQVRGVAGITATTPVRMTTAAVRGTAAGESTQVRVAGLAPDADRVVAAGFDRIDDGVALVQHYTLASLGLHDGDRLTLAYDTRSLAVQVRESDVAQSGIVVLTEQSLDRLDPHAQVAAVWARADDRSPSAVLTEVRQVSGVQPGLEVAGSLVESASMTKLLDALLAVATGLLGVAVLISLIGVGNTLGLSVIERTRESALLRALGLQRRELRLMLAVEAVLLALVGAVVGIAAGVLFGWVGTVAVVEETDLGTLHFAMSAGQTAAVVGVAVVAALLASVIPGRRAALATPTNALAEV